MCVSTSRCWSVDTYNPVKGILENSPASREYFIKLVIMAVLRVV